MRHNKEVKDVLLTGPHGVGKTIVICELAKAAMAERGWETAKVRTFCEWISGTRGRTPELLENLKDSFKPVGRLDVKIVTEGEVLDEFSGALASGYVMGMGRHMELLAEDEEEARLIAVGDEMHFSTNLDENLISNLKRFKNVKFFLALTANDRPNFMAGTDWQKVAESPPQQHIVVLRSQYRNTPKILAFMHFQWEFAEEVRKTTANPEYKLRTIPEPQRSTIRAGPAETMQFLPKPLPSSPGRKSLSLCCLGSETDDSSSGRPTTHPVVWLPVPPEKDLVRETMDAMKRILPTGDQHPQKVVVLHTTFNNYHASNEREDVARKICEAGEKELGTHTWCHYHAMDYIGCEAPVVILLGDDLRLEYFSRARNQLVMVTTGEKMELTEDFYSKYKQRSSKHDFTTHQTFRIFSDWNNKGDIRDMLQLSADLGKEYKMGDKKTFAVPEEDVGN